MSDVEMQRSVSWRPSMKMYRIAAIPGDGIGTEVVSAGVEVLHALAKREGSFQFEVDHFDWGGDYYKRHGRMMPENGRSLIRDHDDAPT
jgi:tartrate dehydrogenase/decarboxylase / D-malate dehydrogenase